MAEGFAILRTKKLKTAGAVHLSLKHAYREQNTPNADPDRTPDNEHHGAQDVAEAMDAFNELMPEKVRKNGVVAIEYLVTGSPEVMAGKTREEQDAYLHDALTWLQERHGAEHVVHASIHRDETTPHLSAHVVPIDPKGKLNASHWLGGSAKMRAMQTEFADKVGKRHGLQRGIEGSRAKHVTMQQYYGRIEQAPRQQGRMSPERVQPQVTRKRLVLPDQHETPEQVAHRLTADMQRYYAPAVAGAAAADLHKKRAAEMARTAEQAERRAQIHERLTAELTREQIQEVAQRAAELREQNREEQEQHQRVERLKRFAVEARGALKILARKAMKALRDVFGKWREVDWEKVERDAFTEATQKGHSFEETEAVMIEHSPATAGLSEEETGNRMEMARLQDQEVARPHEQTHEPDPDDRDHEPMRPEFRPPGLGR